MTPDYAPYKAQRNPPLFRRVEPANDSHPLPRGSLLCNARSGNHWPHRYLGAFNAGWFSGKRRTSWTVLPGTRCLVENPDKSGAEFYSPRISSPPFQRLVGG